MIEHQIEWLMSEAWGVSGDEHTLDFARRVDEYLEAQQFESGLGSLEELPDIVREVYGRARTPQMFFFDEFILADPAKIKAINAINDIERDNGDQSE